MKILVDDREKKAMFDSFDAVKASFPQIKWERKRIPIGDYAFVIDDRTIFIIERKTYKDMAQSFKDDRKNNVKKLLSAREQTECRLFYIIEGKTPYPAQTTKFSNVSYKNIQAHLDHLVLRDNINILYSKDRLMTAKRIFELARNYLTLPENKYAHLHTQADVDADKSDDESKKSGGDKSKAKKKIGAKELFSQKFIRGEADIKKDIWRTIKGVGEKMFIAINSSHITLSDIFNKRVTSKELSKVEMGDKTIGKSRAGKLVDGITDMSPERWNKMLNAVPGIGKVSAKKIAGIIEFADIMSLNDGTYKKENDKVVFSLDEDERESKKRELKDKLKKVGVRATLLAPLVKYLY